MSGFTLVKEWRDLPHQNVVEEIVIRFRITYADDDRKYVERVSATLFRSADPDCVYVIGDLSFGQNMPFQGYFEDGRFIHGHLKWGTGLNVQHSQQIIGRVELDAIEAVSEWNYGGFMIEFGKVKDQPIPEPIPIPDPDPVPGPAPVPAPSDANAIAQTHLDSAELFPFVYITPWPALSPAQISLGFIQMPSSVASASSFITTLIADKTNNDPDKMRTDAVAFIDTALGGQQPANKTNQLWALNAAKPGKVYEKLLSFPHELRVACTNEALNDWVKATFESWSKMNKALNAVAGTEQVAVWEAAMALMVTLGYAQALFADVIRVLQVVQLLETVVTFKKEHPNQEPPEKMLRTAIAATLVLPSDIFPIDPAVTPAIPDFPPIQPYAIGAVQSVHYRPGAYELGDIQRIENVMQGERRQQRSRNLKRTKSSTRDSVSDASATKVGHDTTTADLINQVQKTLSDRVSTTQVNNYDTTYGAPSTNSMSVTGNWWVQEQPAGGFLKDVSKFAQDVIDTSLRKLSQDTVQHRATLQLEEHEVRESRTLSNVDGAQNLRGVYRWVNRIYELETRVETDRLVFEAFLDDPGADLIEAINRYHDLTLTPPSSPADMGINSYSDVSPIPVTGAPPAPPATTPVYYLKAFEAFGVNETLPPPPRSLMVSEGVTSRNPLAELQITVPSGYAPTSASATVTSFANAPTTQVIVGTTPLAAGTPPAGGSTNIKTFQQDLSGQDAMWFGQDNERNSVWASVMCYAPPAAPTPPTDEETGANVPPAADTSPAQGSKEFDTYFLANVQLTCACSDEKQADWQIAAFRLIQSAYDAEMTAYQAQLHKQKEAIEATNPELLNELIESQIIQSIITLFAANSPGVLPTPDGPVSAGTALIEPRFVQFLRNAFDWRGMSVELYIGSQTNASIFMDEGNTALAQLFSPNLFVRNYLRASRARIMLSVKPEAARALLLAWRTGQIWPCSTHLCPCVETDMNLIDTLVHQDHHVPPDQAEASVWKIKVPTSMISLSESNALNDGGC